MIKRKIKELQSHCLGRKFGDQNLKYIHSTNKLSSDIKIIQISHMNGISNKTQNIHSKNNKNGLNKKKIPF